MTNKETDFENKKGNQNEDEEFDDGFDFDDETDEYDEFSPELYEEDEINAIEEHIETYFGSFETVFHEIVSPDIHVDICVIPPDKESGRDFYTLITMGMGAHLMNVPRELDDMKLTRAEMMVTLPSDWDIQNNDEKYYWPLRWLKILARLPMNSDTWLGWGHTVANGGPFAENTELAGVLLLNPYTDDGHVCVLPGGDDVNFYQMVPIYEEEMNYKTENGAEAFLSLFGDADDDDALDHVVNVCRTNVCRLDAPKRRQKNYKITKEDIKPLFDWDGPIGCIATDRITVDGFRVGFMYREESDYPEDSGWRFFAGDESDEYLEDSLNSDVYSLNTIVNYDPEIMEFLKENVGAAYFRGEDGAFLRDEEWRKGED
ncbi:immunity protein Imm33 domain-containing protein [Methanolapillus millepedarum]|uniref:DUF2185 domain-containing protein n=1 Tax=Methanolapillus millepedarum TaxID=3028296 RepID=A0AA96V2J9_9EURY|nr:hypothetical protein MsAc7_02540 [Methanosarcinaceae archaeon Ac7]